MTQPDLGPAAQRMADLITNLDPGALGAPTPCPDYTLGDLVDHVASLTVNFTNVAKKVPGPTDAPPLGNAANLDSDWQTRLPRDLAELADAWRDPNAWTGMAKAGGFEMPSEVAGTIALEELVVHGWDIAQATRQPFDADRASLEVARDTLAQFTGPGKEEQRGSAFGPSVAVAGDAPLLDQVIGMSGRQPG